MYVIFAQHRQPNASKVVNIFVLKGTKIFNFRGFQRTLAFFLQKGSTAARQRNAFSTAGGRA